jgi:hypothetical protein
MYSLPRKPVAGRVKEMLKIDGIPAIESKARVNNANVYLEPLYPNSRISYENYQRQRTWYTKKIH